MCYIKCQCSKRCVLITLLICVSVLALGMMIFGVSGREWVKFLAHVKTGAKNQTISFYLGLWTSQGCYQPGVYHKHCHNGTLEEILKALKAEDLIPHSDLADRGMFKHRLSLKVLINLAWILCLFNTVTAIVSMTSTRKPVIVASVVDSICAVTFCFASFGVGMQQYINTSTEMDKFNNERDSKDIIVEMSVPATLIEVGVGAVLEATISAFVLINVIYKHYKDVEMWKPRPTVTIDCIPEPWFTNVEINSQETDKVPEPQPYDTTTTGHGRLTQL